jgi:hypothetical protein
MGEADTIIDTVAQFDFIGIVFLFSAWEDAHPHHSEGKMTSFLCILPHFLNLATVSIIVQKPHC